MGDFWWQLTHDITIHIRTLSLKKNCLEINVEKIPTSAACHLATRPWFCGRRGIGLLVILLFVLETSQYPSSLRLEEVALVVGLDGKHPSFCHMVPWLDLPHRGQKPHCQSKISLMTFRFTKLFVVSSYFF